MEDPMGLVVTVAGGMATEGSALAAFDEARIYKNAPTPPTMSTKTTQPIVTPTMNPTEVTKDCIVGVDAGTGDGVGIGAVKLRQYSAYPPAFQEHSASGAENVVNGLP